MLVYLKSKGLNQKKKKKKDDEEAAAETHILFQRVNL